MLDRRALLIGAGVTTITACSSRGGNPFAARPLPSTPRAAALIAAARKQIGVTLTYDGGYTRIPFPNGDIPRERGACTDILIRAYRDAFGLDLQALVNEDMKAAFAAYPRTWGLPAPDPNIDHRRVPNLATWFDRHRARLPIPKDPADWRPGDIFTCRVNQNGTHIGLVSDRADSRSPLLIHNYGAGAREQDMLPHLDMTGRFRWSVG
jgi:uncharacterized protein YijF (DUF1287 family)